MKRIGLLLLACLLLALRTVAQAPEKAAPDDLVVTAEIVGYSREPGYKDNFKGVEVDVPPRTCLYARITVRNTTDHVRNVIMYSCSWTDSWIASGQHGFFNATYVSACDKNYLAPVPIPAGDALIFNCPLFSRNVHLIGVGAENDAEYFKLGLLDFATTDDLSRSAAKEIGDRIKKARAVYWSNDISNGVDPTTVKQLTNSSLDFSYRYASER